MFDDLQHDSPNHRAKESSDETSIGRVTLLYIVAHVYASFAIGAPLAHAIISMTNGQLTSPHCTTSAAAKVQFWKRYSAHQLYPLFITFYIVVSRLWMLYEGMQVMSYFQYQSKHSEFPVLRPWAKHWRYTYCITSASFCVIVDTLILFTPSWKQLICSSGVESLSTNIDEEYIIHSICHHQFDQANLSVIFLIVNLACTVIMATLSIAVLNAPDGDNKDK